MKPDFYAVLTDDMHRITRHSEKGLLPMGFNAKTANIEPMDYDFNDWGIPDKGVIPEPSQAAMKVFQKFQLNMNLSLKELRELDLATATAEELEKVQEKSDQVESELDEALAVLCQKTPTQETIAKLPFRAKQAFSQWLMGQLNPEA